MKSPKPSKWEVRAGKTATPSEVAKEMLRSHATKGRTLALPYLSVTGPALRTNSVPSTDFKVMVQPSVSARCPLRLLEVKSVGSSLGLRAWTAIPSPREAAEPPMPERAASRRPAAETPWSKFKARADAVHRRRMAVIKGAPGLFMRFHCSRPPARPREAERPNSPSYLDPRGLGPRLAGIPPGVPVGRQLHFRLMPLLILVIFLRTHAAVADGKQGSNSSAPPASAPTPAQPPTTAPSPAHPSQTPSEPVQTPPLDAEGPVAAGAGTTSGAPAAGAEDFASSPALPTTGAGPIRPSQSPGRFASGSIAAAGAQAAGLSEAWRLRELEAGLGGGAGRRLPASLPPGRNEYGEVSFDPARPMNGDELVVAAMSGYGPVFAHLGLSVGRDASGRSVIIRMDGALAGPGDLAGAQAAIVKEPRALLTRPDFFEVVSRAEFSDLKGALRSGGNADAFRHIGMSREERDILWNESCDRVSGDCNSASRRGGYKKSEFLSPEELEAVWDRVFESGQAELEAENARVSRSALEEASAKLARRLGFGAGAKEAVAGWLNTLFGRTPEDIGGDSIQAAQSQGQSSGVEKVHWPDSSQPRRLEKSGAPHPRGLRRPLMPSAPPPSRPPVWTVFALVGVGLLALGFRAAGRK